MGVATRARRMLDAEKKGAAIIAYKSDVLSLRAVAWIIHIWRSQIGLSVTAADLIGDCGASRTAAYRAVQEVLENDKQSRMSGQKNGSAVPHVGTQKSRKSGFSVPQIGTDTS